jgi:hypothetical protein
MVVNLLAGLMIRRGWRIVRDPLKRSRARWFTLAWIIALGTTLMGGGFAIGGSRIVVARGAFALYARIPGGGLHLHGAIMLVLGLLTCIGIGPTWFGHAEPRRFLRRVLLATACYYGWSTLLLMFAPIVQDGAFSYVGVITWMTLTSLPCILLIGPPPALLPRDETDLIRAAVEVGIEPEKVRALARAFYGGGPDESS